MTDVHDKAPQADEGPADGGTADLRDTAQRAAVELERLEQAAADSNSERTEAKGDAVDDELSGLFPVPVQKALDAEPAKAKPAGKKPGYAFLIVVTVVNVVADLWTKAWAMGQFRPITKRPPSDGIPVLTDIAGKFNLQITFAQNRGGAWGLLQGEVEELRRPFFLVVSVAAIVFIVHLYHRLEPGQRALKWGLPLVLGGALGNLVDRVRYGWVVDFIDVFLKTGDKINRWPTFNVADIAICVGVVLMAIDMFTPRREAEPAPKSASVPA